MLKRAQTVMGRDILYYSLGCKKFVDLRSVLYPVAENVISYAMRVGNSELAFLFSSLNRVCRAIFFDALRRLPIENFGIENSPYSPAFCNFRERVAWKFDMCHICGYQNANVCFDVPVVEHGDKMTIHLCGLCHYDQHLNRIACRGQYLKGGSFIITGCSILEENDGGLVQTLKRNMDAAKTKVVFVARQKWIACSPAARRAQLRQTKNGGGRTKATRIYEIAIVVALPGEKGTKTYHLCLQKLVASKLIRSTDSVQRIRTLLSDALGLRQREGLVKYLTTPCTPAVETPPRSRKQPAPLKTPSTLCTHGFGSARRTFNLLKCSACRLHVVGIPR